MKSAGITEQIETSSSTVMVTHTHIFSFPEKLRELKWEILVNCPYSSGFVPPVYHLFRSVKNLLKDVSADSVEKGEVATFRPEITQVLHRWNYVVT